MRERVEQLVGARARAMWVMTFHSACARMLRSEAQRLGYTRGYTIYDEADSLRLVKQCVEELDIDPKRFAPRGIRRQISDAKNQLLDAEAYRLKVDSFFEQTAADVYELYEQRIHANNAMDFDDLLFRCVNLFELFSEVRDRYRNQFRHVLVDEYQDTNRAQYRWLQLLAEEHRNLCVVGDDDQAIYGFRGADVRNILEFEDDFPDAAHGQARAELPLDADDPRRRQRGRLATTAARKEKSLWTDADRGRARPRARARRRARGGPLRGRRDRAPRGRRRLARRGGGLLPDQRPEPGARGHAGALRRRLPGDRRHALLRAGRDQGRAGLPDAAREPRRRGGLPADRQLAPARHRPDLAGPDRRPREHGRRVDLGRGREARGGAGPGRRGGQGGRAGSCRSWSACASGRRAPAWGTCCARPSTRRATWRRSRPSGRSRRRGGWRTSRSWWAWRASTTPPRRSPTLEEFLQQIALFSEQDQPPRRGGDRHADDPPQRQGARVPDRVHDRLRGRRVPALARDRGRATSRRSGASATWASPAPSASSTSPTRARGPSTAGATGTCAAASSTRSRPS